MSHRENRQSKRFGLRVKLRTGEVPEHKRKAPSPIALVVAVGALPGTTGLALPIEKPRSDSLDGPIGGW
jgi:hypothetical protein